jgi:phosphotransferase family enzyme
VIENGRVASHTALVSPEARSHVTNAATSAGRPGPNVARHPAVQAWSRLYPHAEPLGIEPLRVRRQKNKIYRLVGVGRAGAAVIAKQCRKATAVIERTVYEELLPRLAAPSLHHYGFVEEPDSEYCWLFMEEATGAEYSRLLAPHRAEAARWLGLLHASAADAVTRGMLPDAGPGRYLDLLHAIRELFRQHLDNPVLSPEDVAYLHEMQARLDDLAAHWGRLEEICGGLPQTLVHGDFNGKNIRVRFANGNTAVVVFDWENAGWGVPAVDLAQQAVPSSRLSANPDLSTYWSTVRHRWPGSSLTAWQRLADCGTVFRALAALYWDGQNLANDWAHAFVGGMHMSLGELEAALRRLDWEGPATPVAAVDRATGDREP